MYAALPCFPSIEPSVLAECSPKVIEKEPRLSLFVRERGELNELLTPRLMFCRETLERLPKKICASLTDRANCDPLRRFSELSAEPTIDANRTSQDP